MCAKLQRSQNALVEGVLRHLAHVPHPVADERVAAGRRQLRGSHRLQQRSCATNTISKSQHPTESAARYLKAAWC